MGKNRDRVSQLRGAFLLIPILLLLSIILLFVVVLSGVNSASYADLKTLIETNTAVFGTLLGIITAGLMFTQAKFGELAGELSDKSPDYLRNVLSLQEMQSIGENLLAWRKLFAKLANTTEIPEEKNLYRRIATESSSMFVNVAVLLNLKLAQQGLAGTHLLISEMSPNEHEDYGKKWHALKKDWHLFNLVKQIVNRWVTVTVIPTTKIGLESSLHSDVGGSIPILKLKENVDKSSEKIHLEVENTLNELDNKISKIVTRFHEDRIPQLMTQMEQASVVRGKYFYLSLIFIAAPLLVNLVILPQLSEGTMPFLMQAIALTSSLAILGVIILLFYISKMLNV
jgi:hypothetical protein